MHICETKMLDDSAWATDVDIIDWLYLWGYVSKYVVVIGELKSYNDNKNLI